MPTLVELKTAAAARIEEITISLGDDNLQQIIVTNVPDVLQVEQILKRSQNLLTSENSRHRTRTLKRQHTLLTNFVAS